jgi:hypothetical protein
MALIPGIGSIGWGHQTSSGFKIDQPLLRGSVESKGESYAT